MKRWDNDSVEDLLTAAVGVGPWPVAALRDIILSTGVTGYRLRKAVSSVTRDGLIAVWQPRLWVSASDIDEWRKNGGWVEGHSREELIARLDARSNPPPIRESTTDHLMQGEDADRLAREDFGRNG